MNAEIISIGTELMRGEITNTNAQFLAKELSDLGISVKRQSTVGDNPEKLREVFKRALEDHDLIITSGGLGPTQDDLTKEILAEVLDKKLLYSKEAERDLKAWFRIRGIILTDNNLRQVYYPEGSKQIKNNHGSAPGILYQDNEKTIILLPGPPREMKLMFEESVKEILKNLTNLKVISEYIETTGLGESFLETELYDLIDNQKDVSIATYAKPDEVLVRLTSAGTDETLLHEKLDTVFSEIEKRIGDRIYAKSPISLGEAVTKVLIKKNLTISTAESCTGGLLSATFTAIPGSSKSFLLGIASYSPQAKEDILGISSKIIQNYGTVSYQTCYYMCENIKKLIGSDIAVSITGVAGPESSEGKPVGLVYVGLCTNEGFRLTKHRFSGTRDEIRLRAVNAALKLIRTNLFSRAE